MVDYLRFRHRLLREKTNLASTQLTQYNMSTQQENTIDITPTPRVLRMLGEIDLPPERCFAEFIDNALDEGIEGKPGRKSADDGGEEMRIEIETPTLYEFDDAHDEARILVRDTGPGMSKEELERNLRAGYSGKDPVDEMGLFGMGFNIATARLGNRTTVRTTRTGDESWAVVTIDFQKLEAQNSYELEVEEENKADSSDHGTEIIIEQLEEVSRTLRRQSLDETLGDMYTPVLENENVAIIINGDEITARPHCIWNKERSVEIGNEEFPAYIPIEEKVGDGYYCKNCWTWWEDRFVEPDAEDETDLSCPACENGGDVDFRDQLVYGWVGIQRFFHESHYGIDLIRNGRVIEKHDKSLFDWENPETGEMEKEYPIDTTHWGGRIVGELHIDFVPVTNVKDAFRKQNERWKKVREAVRGEGPFRPTYADDYGYEPNRSPLGRLFKGYRTGNEPGKKRLVPGKVTSDGDVKAINAEPQEWAEKFWQGDPEYSDDTKWWEAVERAEQTLRDPDPDPDDADSDVTDISQNSDDSNDQSESDTDDFFDPDTDSDELDVDDHNGEDSDDDTGPEEDSISEPLETEVDEDNSRKYGLEDIDQPDIKINARKVISGSLDGNPAEVISDSFNERTVRYDPTHDVFTGFGHEPIDAILMEIAGTFLTRMDDKTGWYQSRVYAELKSKYCADDRVTPEALASRAASILQDIGERVAQDEHNLNQYEVTEDIKTDVERNFFKNSDPDGRTIDDLIETSEYLAYAPNEEIIRYFEEHPEQFFDGTIWGRAYSDLSSEALRAQSVNEFLGYLKDARMLAEEALTFELGDANSSQAMELERAAISLRILESELVSE